jgi:hypothetical protein
VFEKKKIFLKNKTYPKKIYSKKLKDKKYKNVVFSKFTGK